LSVPDDDTIRYRTEYFCRNTGNDVIGNNISSWTHINIGKKLAVLESHLKCIEISN